MKKVFKTKKSFIKNLMELGETKEKALEIFNSIAPENKKDYHFELEVWDKDDPNAIAGDEGYRDRWGDILQKNPNYAGDKKCPNKRIKQ